jgi:hypothetical protein
VAHEFHFLFQRLRFICRPGHEREQMFLAFHGGGLEQGSVLDIPAADDESFGHDAIDGCSDIQGCHALSDLLLE